MRQEKEAGGMRVPAILAYQEDGSLTYKGNILDFKSRGARDAFVKLFLRQSGDSADHLEVGIDQLDAEPTTRRSRRDGTPPARRHVAAAGPSPSPSTSPAPIARATALSFCKLQRQEPCARTLADYDFEARLPHSALGGVAGVSWLARERGTSRQVALEIVELPANFTGCRGSCKSRSLDDHIRLRHRHLLRLYTWFSVGDGRACLVLEPTVGHTLRDILLNAKVAIAAVA
ncbi:unnamed protein product, partial [Phaeothamnion confervicola]